MAGKKREAGGIQRCISYGNTGEMSWTQLFGCTPRTFEMCISKEAAASARADSQWLRHIVLLTALPLCGDMLSISLFPDLLESHSGWKCILHFVYRCDNQCKRLFSVSISSWLAATHPCPPLPPALLAALVTSAPLSACSMYQMVLPTLIFICIWITRMKTAVKRN